MEELKEVIENLESRIDSNTERMIATMNELHSHENKINANAEKTQQNSLALDILKDSKNQTRKLFVIWIITFIALIGVTCYMVYLLNDISTIEATQEVTDINTINGSVVNNGDAYGEN